MRLTTFSDYALRLLIYAATSADRLITIEEVHQSFGISRGHLMKVANLLTREGYLKSVRGRSGGLKLAKPAKEIRLGDLLRATEPDFALVECFAAGGHCVISRCCTLPHALNDGLNAFVQALNQYTLDNIVLRPKDFELRPGKSVFRRRGPQFGVGSSKQQATRR